MTIRHMRIFIAVYEEMNMTRAAQQLHIAQPAVSRAIQEMEHYYGVRLFERLGRGLCATECGRELYGYALHVDETFGELERRLLNWDATGVLRVGATTAIGNCELPGLVRRFMSARPGMRVRARVANAQELTQALMAGELDIALTEGASVSPELISQPFGGDVLTLIVAQSSRLCEPEQVALDDVLREPLLLREPGSACRALVDRLLEERGRAVEPAWESASTQALVRAVEAGLGVALLPERLVRDDVAAGRVCARAIQGVELRYEFSAVWHKHKYLTAAVKAFIDLCSSEPDVVPG